MKKYRLLKDLPGISAGTIWNLEERKGYLGIVYPRLSSEIEFRVVLDTDWFEEVKPWPQWKDDLFYINFDGVIQEASLGSECSSTNAAKGWGNCFRTREKAIEARDRIESILKEMSDLEK